MHFDFEGVLVIATIVTGLCALWQRWRLQRWRLQAHNERAEQNGEDSIPRHAYLGILGSLRLLLVPIADPEHTPEAGAGPRERGGIVEFARSLFPVILVVLIIRSFVAEPFRIPSGSMIPTLLQGDFILVNKTAYGIHLPVTHHELIATGQPARGDVAVFRYPEDPSTDYIKRIVGLPGDHIRYTADNKLYVDGELMAQESLGDYPGNPIYELRKERLAGDLHEILVYPPQRPLVYEGTIPEGQYFVLGDNRNRSQDSRRWGTVPAENLVGRAWLVWFHLDFADGSFKASRIGTRVN
jgi:signal peptidase I